MNFIFGKELERVRTKYPKGTMIQLDFMDDIYAPPVGTVGEVMYVDDIGQIHVNWENGSGLALNMEIDEFHIIENKPIKPKKEKVKEFTHIVNSKTKSESYTEKDIEDILCSALEPDEIIRFNEGKYTDIIPVLYSIELLDSSGAFHMVSTKKHNEMFIEGGFSGINDAKLMEHRKMLKKVFANVEGDTNDN